MAATLVQPVREARRRPDPGIATRRQFLTGAAAAALLASRGSADQASPPGNGLEAQFAAARQAYPEFAGKTIASGVLGADFTGAYTSADPRARILDDLGFNVPEAINELAEDTAFFAGSALSSSAFLTRTSRSSRGRLAVARPSPRTRCSQGSRSCVRGAPCSSPMTDCWTSPWP